jgi:hypothetical protein
MDIYAWSPSWACSKRKYMYIWMFVIWNKLSILLRKVKKYQIFCTILEFYIPSVLQQKSNTVKL